MSTQVNVCIDHVAVFTLLILYMAWRLFIYELNFVLLGLWLFTSLYYGYTCEAVCIYLFNFHCWSVYCAVKCWWVYKPECLVCCLLMCLNNSMRDGWFKVNVQTVHCTNLFLLLRRFCFLFKECLPGFYGDGCNQTCACANGGSCDPVHGRCACPPGFHGNACEEGRAAVYLKFVSLKHSWRAVKSHHTFI